MNVPILAGTYVDGNPAVRIAYPVNMVPVPGQDGITDGFLRPAEGIRAFATGQGLDRGALVWTGAGNNVHYRVSGTKLVSVSSSGVVTTVGDVGGSGPARMDFSFDRLGIQSNGKLYYWDNITLAPVTNVNIPPNLIDMVWVDGYWMVTDGTQLAVSDLAAPATFNPLKFGTTDRPDPVQCLLKVLNEVHVISRNFIDVFQNVGGTLFPFARVSSAVISKGAVGTRAACVFEDNVAFVGGGRNEAVSVYLGRNAQTVKISSREIDNLLLDYTTAELSGILMETVLDRGSLFLYIHLPDRTIVYDRAMSQSAGQPVWFQLTTSLADFSQYRARNMTRVNDVWVVGDPQSSAIGVWSTTDSQHFGTDVRWEFSTPMLRNEARGAIIHELELTALTGATPSGRTPTVSTSYSVDGRLWSPDRPVASGVIGDTTRRLKWFKQGAWRKYRIQRFRGDSGSRLTAMKLDAVITPLAY